MAGYEKVNGSCIYDALTSKRWKIILWIKFYIIFRFFINN